MSYPNSDLEIVVEREPKQSRPFLVSGMQGKVDFLVTGDKKHFEKLKETAKYRLRIVSSAEMVDSILPVILKDYEEKE